jgi:hypothetical protein
VMEHRRACSVCKSLGERAWGKSEAEIVFSVDCRNQDNVKIWTVLTNAICLFHSLQINNKNLIYCH